MVTVEEALSMRRRQQEADDKLLNQERIANLGRLDEQDPILLTLTDIRNFILRIMQYQSFSSLDGKILGSRFDLAETSGIYYIDFLNSRDHSTNIASGTIIRIPRKPVYAIVIENEGSGTLKVGSNERDAENVQPTFRINNGKSFVMSSSPSPLPIFTGMSIFCDGGTDTTVNIGLMT